MTLMVMMNTDFLWTLRVYHNHLRSIVFVVYICDLSNVQITNSGG
jgi:hypothetical protein